MAEPVRQARWAATGVDGWRRAAAGSWRGRGQSQGGAAPVRSDWPVRRRRAWEPLVRRQGRAAELRTRSLLRGPLLTGPLTLPALVQVRLGV